MDILIAKLEGRTVEQMKSNLTVAPGGMQIRVTSIYWERQGTFSTAHNWPGNIITCSNTRPNRGGLEWKNECDKGLGCNIGQRIAIHLSNICGMAVDGPRSTHNSITSSESDSVGNYME